MNILRFLFKQSRGIFAIAVLTGVISGGAGAALLGIINKSLAKQGGSLTMFVWAFVGLCIAVTLARVVSHVLLVRLGEDSVLEIRLDVIGGSRHASR